MSKTTVTSIAYIYISGKDGSERFGSILTDEYPPKKEIGSGSVFSWAMSLVEDSPRNKGHKSSEIVEFEIKQLEI